MKFFKSKVVISLSVLLFIAACGGSDGDGDGANASIGETSGRNTVWGRVVDLSTQKGVSEADIKLYTGTGIKSTVTAVDNEGTTDFDESGYFVVNNVADGRHRLQVSVESYATYEEWLTLGTNMSGSEAIYYAANGNTDGKIQLSKGCGANVYVQSDGVPVSGAVIYADDYSGGNVPEITAISDSTGLAIFSGLSQTASYSFIAPAYDSDEDGMYNYQTSSFSGYGCDDSDGTAAMELNIARRDDSISVIDGSFENYVVANTFSGNLGTDPNKPIIFVFNYPVEITVGLNALSFDNTYVLSTNPAYNAGVLIEAESSLSAGNTILTVTPASPLTPNVSYELVGTVSAVIYGERQYSDFDSINWWNLSNWYAFYPGSWTIDNVSADNYNGSNDDSLATEGHVFLEFPEYVYGRAEVKSYTTDGVTTTYVDSAADEINLAGGTIVIDEGNANVRANSGAAGFCLTGADPCGCPTHDSASALCSPETTPAGEIKYVVGIPVSIVPVVRDWTSAVPVTVTVFIDATDYEGNQYAGTVTLPVQ